MPRLPEGYAVVGTYRRGAATVHLAVEDRHGGREVLLLVEPTPAPGAGGALPDYHHPGLPAVVEGILDGGTRWLVLAQPPGITLDRLLEGGLLTEDQALALTAQLASALEHLHRLPRPMAMGALAPRWVRVDERGRACLNFLAVDAGAPAEGFPLDPRYAAPELAGGQPPGPLCDVYSLGRILGAATGLDHPVRRRLQGGPTGAIVELATRADPGARFGHMAALRAAVEQRQAEVAFRRAERERQAPGGADHDTDTAREVLLASTRRLRRSAGADAAAAPPWAAVEANAARPPARPFPGRGRPRRRAWGLSVRGAARAVGRGVVVVTGAVARGAGAVWTGAAYRMIACFDFIWGYNPRHRRRRRRRRFCFTDPALLPAAIMIGVLVALALLLLLTASPARAPG